MCRGGRRVRICFVNYDSGLIMPVVKELAYPHSKWAKKHSGCGEWVLWEGSPKRPAQAFKDLFFLFRDLGWIDNAEGVRLGMEYFESGSLDSRDERLQSIKKLIK
jgi:hypothetical protein